MEIRNAYKRCRGNINISALIVAVYPLAAGKNRPHLCLRHIFVLTQITNTRIIRHGGTTFHRDAFIIARKFFAIEF